MSVALPVLIRARGRTLSAREPPLGAMPGALVDPDQEFCDEESLWNFGHAPPGG